MSFNSETDKVAVTVTASTGKAYRLRDNENTEREDWFPASEISFDRRNVKTGDAVADIPLWLLKAKGWE